MTAPHKHAEILRAIADGKEVECKLAGSWNTYRYSEIDRESISPLTNADLEWRIKPEKQVLRYRVALMNDGDFYSATADNEKDAKDLKKSEYFVEWVSGWQEMEVE